MLSSENLTENRCTIQWQAKVLDHRPLLIFSIWHEPPYDLAMLREWKLHLQLGLKRGEGASPVYLQIVHGPDRGGLSAAGCRPARCCPGRGRWRKNWA